MNEPLPKTQLLIADDHPENILLLMDSIDDDSSIIVAKDGVKALEQARKHVPDLILLDVMMPGMDGFAVCAALKADERTKQIPVIFVTAMRDAFDEEQGLRLGAIDYIRKPIDPGVTRVRIRNHLELRRKTRLLEELARLDGLTEINNRRGFNETLEREWMRAQRQAGLLSLAILDIDHFKAYNDTYGHAQGDRCLIQVARFLRGGFKRSTDIVARYGGEEFVILMPDTPLDTAFGLVQAAVSGIAALGLPHRSSPIAEHVTISAGVASRVPSAQENPVHLVECADAALYRAKSQGRNHVAAAE
ncbi:MULTISPECIES: diguanylate cyclase domain-containing protein [unclassified Thiocapsa]|uniref:GGDEF domain-containing response regulator n=1 Tax=unclassified Thiocapsa TaxID=2641286 RepID=UPI0035B2ACBD